MVQLGEFSESIDLDMFAFQGLWPGNRTHACARICSVTFGKAILRGLDVELDVECRN